MTLQEYIEQTILPQYDAFDGGHKRDHAEAVILNEPLLHSLCEEWYKSNR